MKQKQSCYLLSLYRAFLNLYKHNSLSTQSSRLKILCCYFSFITKYTNAQLSKFDVTFTSSVHMFAYVELLWILDNKTSWQNLYCSKLGMICWRLTFSCRTTCIMETSLSYLTRSSMFISTATKPLLSAPFKH